MKQVRRHLTYANVMSSLAVFLILGGATAFAAVSKVGANEIKANSIKTGKIVKEAVTAGKLKKGAVTESRIADGAVTTSKLADNAVTSPKLANDAVTSGKLANDAVTSGKLANDAVTNGKLANGAVTGNKIGAAAVSRANIAEAKFIPRAYAFVNGSGTVLPAFTDGIPNATKGGTGIYCFDLAFSPIHAQVSQGADGDSNDLPSVDLEGVGGALSGCPAGNDVKVEVRDTGSNTNVDEEFFLVVW